MTNYTKSTNFATKDTLTSGDPLKIVKGTEINTEFDNIQTAVNSKADTVSPTFTGTVVIPTATITTANISAGTITGITDLTVADGGTGASTAENARTNLGLVIGTNVQAWDADLDTWATKTAPSGTVVGTSDTQTLTNKTLTTPNINSAQFATVDGTAPLYAARAWVNFNGTGTVAIRGSGNVSSITDNGTGDYTVNFTDAITDVNYAVNITTSIQGTTSTNGGFIPTLSRTSTPVVGSVRIEMFTTTFANTDTLQANVTIFR